MESQQARYVVLDIVDADLEVRQAVRECALHSFRIAEVQGALREHLVVKLELEGALDPETKTAKARVAEYLQNSNLQISTTP